MASLPGAMIYPQWLEPRISRANFHGHKDGQVIAIRLYTTIWVISFASSKIIPYLPILKYSDRQPRTNIVNQDQTPQKAASDQGLQCLLLVQQFLKVSTSSQMDLFEFEDMYSE